VGGGGTSRSSQASRSVLLAPRVETWSSTTMSKGRSQLSSSMPIFSVYAHRTWVGDGARLRGRCSVHPSVHPHRTWQQRAQQRAAGRRGGHTSGDHAPRSQSCSSVRWMERVRGFPARKSGGVRATTLKVGWGWGQAWGWG